MPRKRQKTRRNSTGSIKNHQPAASRPSDVITIARTVSVTGVAVADLMFAAAHLFARGQPQGHPARALEAILLLSAAGMGAVSLALLAAAWHVRQLKPPPGYLAFAALVAIAPIAVLVSRLF